MRLCSLSAPVFGVLLALSAPAAAERIKLTLSGTVQQVSDGGGLIGSPAAGDSYRLTYIADFSKGVYGGGAGGFGGDVYLIGGTSLDPMTGPPTIQISPVSARLSLNGHDLAFPGLTYGEMQYVENSYDVMFGGTGESWAILDAEDVDSSILTNLKSDSFSTFLVDLSQPMTVAIDGTHVTGQSSFTFTSGSGGHVSGTLVPTSYTVSTAVPEPASWLLMLAGFSVAGAMLRRKQPGHGARIARQSC